MRVIGLRRYPVKSMLGEELVEASVDGRGLAGDRAFGLIDEETNKVVSVKRPKMWGRIFELRATTEGNAVRVTFPDGWSAVVGDDELPVRLSAFFGRSVSIASAPPPNPTFDEVWERDLKEGASPYLGMPSRVEDGDEMIDAVMGFGVPDSFFNLGAIHVVTTSTVRALSAAAPGSRFDAHRFRPNIVVETDEDGFVETRWQGRTLVIGEVRFPVFMTVPRCVMTTLAQDDLPADREVLRTIARTNPVEVVGARYPCVGVYTNVTEEGTIRVGDPVRID